MSTQESLTFLFDAIALGFITIAAIDLSREIFVLYNQVFITPTQPTLIDSQSQVLPQLPDPWLLPLEVVGSAEQITQVQPKPIPLLAPAKAVDEVQLSTAQSTIEDLLIGVDVNTLKLRQARKIAKALGIAQKVNGRDQKLEFLRNQMKLKLQQAKFEIVQSVAQELLAC